MGAPIRISVEDRLAPGISRLLPASDATELLHRTVRSEGAAAVGASANLKLVGHQEAFRFTLVALLTGYSFGSCMPGELPLTFPRRFGFK